MLVKNVIDEDFVNYKYPAMFIGCHSCTFKCDQLAGQPVCQNGALAAAADIEVNPFALAKRFCANPLTCAVVFGGLEPLDDADTVEIFMIYLRTLEQLRHLPTADVVIYTGYTEEEAWKQNHDFMNYLCRDPASIVKFGRYLPGQQPHFDEVLGINLSSDNQYAKRMSNEQERI